MSTSLGFSFINEPENGTSGSSRGFSYVVEPKKNTHIPEIIVKCPKCNSTEVKCNHCVTNVCKHKHTASPASNLEIVLKTCNKCTKSSEREEKSKRCCDYCIIS
jgi:hypothetical protein